MRKQLCQGLCYATFLYNANATAFYTDKNDFCMKFGLFVQSLKSTSAVL